MNKSLNKKLITLLVVLGGLFALTGFVQANSNLEVNFFGYDPLFDQANFLPGDSVSRDVKVTNNSGQVQSVIVEAINYDGFPNIGDVPNDDLSRALIIVIREKGGVGLYGDSTGEKTLFNFYGDGEIYLSDIPSSSYQEYKFEISFPSEKENEWKLKTTNFDILIGFQGENGGEDDNGDNGNGGGGSGPPPGLTITNEKSEVTEQCVTAIINWQTNYFSTSKVIYDTTPDKFNFSQGPEGYGYQYWEEGDTSGLEKVTAHEVELTGLISETTYYYRCVSHASPATISYEGTFITCCPEETYFFEEETEKGQSDEGEEPTEEFTGLTLGPGSTLSIGGEKGSTEEEPAPEEEAGPEEVTQKEEEGEPGAFLAAIAGLFTGGNFCWILTLIITALIVLYILSRKKKKLGKGVDHYRRDSIIAIIILIILTFLIKCYLLIIPIIILLIFLLKEKFSKNQNN